MALSPFMSRGELLTNLSEAVLPQNARSVFAVFGFVGLRGYLNTMSTSDGDGLLERLAARLTQVVAGTVRLYASRRGEFCALFEGDLGGSWTMIPAALDQETWAIGIRTSFVLVFLPSEASSPAAALQLADDRLQAQDGKLRPERRS